MKSICLMFHDIYHLEPLSTIPRSASMYHISEEDFIRHLKIIKTSGLNVLTASDFNNFQNNSIIITFDDGWKGSYEIALPILKEFEFKATFFVTKDFIGQKGFCNKELILRASKSGMEIGVHGTSHRMLSNLSKEEIKLEFAICKDFLEDLLDEQVESASLPGGFWNKVIATCAKETGLKKLFTSSPGINRANHSMLNLKRIGIRENTNITDIKRFCDFNIKKELLRDKVFQFPRRMLGMKRYSLLRRYLLGEKSEAINKVFEP